MGTDDRREVLLPDIGDFEDVDVAEVLVSAGDRVAAEDSLIVLETDKASMEIPAPFAGVVLEMKVSVGDRVSQGALIAILEVEGAVEEGPEDEEVQRPGKEVAACHGPSPLESEIQDRRRLTGRLPPSIPRRTNPSSNRYTDLEEDLFSRTEPLRRLRV